MVDISEPVVYHPTKANLLWRITQGSVFLVAGGYLIYMRQVPVLGIGLASLGFLGVALYMTALCFPGTQYLRVSAAGIEIRALFKVRRYDWSQLRFYIARFGLGNAVWYDYVERGESRSRKGFLTYTYGFSTQELASRLNEWQMLAASEKENRGE
jgi:hypothetical protein